MCCGGSWSCSWKTAMKGWRCDDSQHFLSWWRNGQRIQEQPVVVRLDTSWVDPTQLVQIWEMIHNQESWWQLVRKSTSQRWSYWVYYTHATCNRMIIFQDMRWVFEIYAEWSSSWMREWVSCARGDCDGRCDINFLSPYFLFNSINNI